MKGHLVRVTVKGQVTIPQPIRRAAGIEPGTEVEFVLGDDGVIILRRAEAARLTELKAGIERLRGSANAGMTTDEIMRLTRG